MSQKSIDVTLRGALPKSKQKAKIMSSSVQPTTKRIASRNIAETQPRGGVVSGTREKNVSQQISRASNVPKDNSCNCYPLLPPLPHCGASPSCEPCDPKIPSSACCYPCRCSPLPPPTKSDCCKVKKLQFLDPCNDTVCKWQIAPDECGSDSLVVRCDGKDVALLGCNGDLLLLGKVDTTKICVVGSEDVRWQISANEATGALEIQCGDGTPVLISKSGSIVSPHTDVTFSTAAGCQHIPFVPAGIIVHNPSLYADNKLKLDNGSFNGQRILIVNVNAVAFTLEAGTLSKIVAGETSLELVWVTTLSQWICIN